MKPINYTNKSGKSGESSHGMPIFIDYINTSGKLSEGWVMAYDRADAIEKAKKEYGDIAEVIRTVPSR